MNAGTLLKRRADAIGLAASLHASIKAESRDFTTDERAQYDRALMEIGSVGAALNFGTVDQPGRTRNHVSAYLPLAGAISDDLAHRPVRSGVERTPDGGLWAPREIRADVSEAGEGAGIMPFPAVERIEAPVALPSLRRAGAMSLGGEIPFGDALYSRGGAFVTPGPAAIAYAEGTSVTGSHEGTIYPCRVVPEYFSNQFKVGIPFYQDLQPIVQAGLLRAMIDSLLFSIDAAWVATLITAIPLVNPLDSYSDLYSAALAAIADIHSYFVNNGTCCWVGGRQARKAFLDVRNSIGSPIFEPASTTGEVESLLGFPWFTSEAAGPVAIFGNFRDVLILETGTWLQILRELYAEQGQFGLKVHCRAGMKSYPEVVPAGKPQPLSLVDTDRHGS